MKMTEGEDHKNIVEPILSVGFRKSYHKRSVEFSDEGKNIMYACESVIRVNLQPTLGHIKNGSLVEIYQSSDTPFRTNFVECLNHDRPSCNGINKMNFKSECVTLYEYIHVGVRILNSNFNYESGELKIPIACQCRLEERIYSHNILTEEV
uniref:NGF domain-containing protein n=1 Tax=Parastrongyloides trichosuri TaxID=131310 RepID=A0A0N4Z960_PARTI